MKVLYCFRRSELRLHVLWTFQFLKWHENVWNSSTVRLLSCCKFRLCGHVVQEGYALDLQIFSSLLSVPSNLASRIPWTCKFFNVSRLLKVLSVDTASKPVAQQVKPQYELEPRWRNWICISGKSTSIYAVESWYLAVCFDTTLQKSSGNESTDSELFKTSNNII